MKTVEGNKALLAAAPALLAACMALVNRLYVVLGSAEESRCREEIKAAEAVIARATMIYAVQARRYQDNEPW